jgi:3-oxoisoapionate decarboxylase
MPLRLGIDTFSVRFQGWDAFQTLDYAAEQGLDVVQFSTWENLASHEPGYLAEVKAHADRLGLDVEVGMGSIDRHAQSFRPELGSAEEQLTSLARAASALGSPVLRCFLGAQSDRQGAVPIQEHVDECVRVIQAVAPMARERGLKVAVEDHGWGDLLAHELNELVERAGPDVAAVTLDTGNPVFGAEDPVYTAEVLAPYIATTHFRDTAIWEHPKGAEGQWTVLGKGNADLKSVLRILEERTPGDVAVCLETITGIPPRLVPYLEPEGDFWKMYPDMPAPALARFVAMARRGTEMGLQPLEQIHGGPRADTPAEEAEKVRRQQLEHFEEGVRYAKKELGLGRRGQASN